MKLITFFLGMSVFTLGIFHALITLMTTGSLGVFAIYAGAAFLAVLGSALVLEIPVASVSIFGIGALLMAICRTEPYEELWPKLIVLQVSFMIVSGLAYHCHRVANRRSDVKNAHPTGHDIDALRERSHALEAAATMKAFDETLKRLVQSNAG